MKPKLILFVLTIIFSINIAFSQENNQIDSTSTKINSLELKHRHTVGISLFMLYNFFPESADYYQFNYSYQLTQKDLIVADLRTWKYNEPIGTYGDSDELYPGKVRAYGITVGYTRFHWKNLFTTVEATNFIQQIYYEKNTKSQKGYQLYLAGIVGYRIEFFKKRFFVEPAYAIKYWPVNSNFPDDFAEIEKGKPNYIFEPHLNFGFKF